jgi:ribokinase
MSAEGADAGRTLVVVGAINVDLVVRGSRLPASGETVVGGTFSQHHGGKGGNQAVAAARALAGVARVALVAAVGHDPYGDAAREVLALEGVDVSGVAVDRGAATGVALIAVDAAGENQISVAPGANASLSAAAVTDALDARGSDVAGLLASLEVPLVTVEAAGRWCRDHGVPFVLNPAPARPEAHDLLSLATHVTPNAAEISILAAQAEEPRGAAARLAASYPGLRVVVTLGAGGAIANGPDGEIHQPGAKVRAVDTTGAGDCFNGVFTAGIVEGLPLPRALRRACAAAALSVTAEGAREGMPDRVTIEAAIGD